MTDTSKSLRYDMGNIGDLLKHGVMAEFIRWWSCINSDKKNFEFFDPFCGLCWTCPAKENLLKRLHDLRDNNRDCDFAIINAQPDFNKGKYYGSAHVVINQTLQIKRKEKLLPVVFVSDKSPENVKALEKSSKYIKKLDCPGFCESDGYSILDSIINCKHINPDMVLIDSYNDMDEIICRISSIIKACEKTTIILFVIGPKKKWEQIRQESPPNSIILTCPPIGTKGEKRRIGVILSSYLFTETKNDSLRDNIECYANALSKVTFLPDTKKRIRVLPSS